MDVQDRRKSKTPVVYLLSCAWDDRFEGRTASEKLDVKINLPCLSLLSWLPLSAPIPLNRLRWTIGLLTRLNLFIVTLLSSLVCVHQTILRVHGNLNALYIVPASKINQVIQVWLNQSKYRVNSSSAVDGTLCRMMISSLVHLIT